MTTSAGTVQQGVNHCTVADSLPFHTSSRVNSIADAQCGVRKLLTRKPDQRVAAVPPHLKEQFLNGDRNSCLILQEYCQVRRMKLSYEVILAVNDEAMLMLLIVFEQCLKPLVCVHFYNSKRSYGDLNRPSGSETECRSQCRAF